ncbi:helix-turn-helix domain-containing protein [Massilia aerilata]|uniref:Helix-turn-helix domain-containing protein n=1 Tax=Massilia aerilata TaxID=453817 RepID=A0ABW0S4W2_9BURK
MHNVAFLDFYEPAPAPVMVRGTVTADFLAGERSLLIWAMTRKTAKNTRRSSRPMVRKCGALARGCGLGNGSNSRGRNEHERKFAATHAQLVAARGKRTQVQIAEILGVSRATVQNWENGRSPISRTAWQAVKSIPA